MAHTCGSCGGSGTCQNDHHDLIDGIVEGGTLGLVSSDCPACGGTAMTPGNCSVCGGSGEQDDDD